MFNSLNKEINDVRKRDIVMFPERMSDIFLLYKEYLVDIYKQEVIACDDKLAISPSGEYINLALVNKGQSTNFKDPFTRSTLHGGVDQILATKTPLEMDALVAPGSQFVLVEGPAGIGKSSLCWELCRKWDTLKSLQKFQILLHLKLRERRVQTATSLDELFYHDNKKLNKAIVDKVFGCEGEHVLLILDGFDEMPISLVNAGSALIMRLIKGQCLTKAVRIVTSRPSALPNKQCFPQKYRHVEILGFTDTCIIQFAEKAFKTEPEILARFQKFIFSNPIITSLMYIPVNCAILAQIYKEVPDIAVPKTMTQLYTLLVLVLIRRHLIQTGRWTVESKVPADLKGLPEDIKADLMRVSELAFKSLMKEDVQIIFTCEDVGESFHHLGLLNKAKEMYVFKGAATYYSFLHLSIQEYMAAWYVYSTPKVYALFTRLLLRDHHQILLYFLCGMRNKLPAISAGFRLGLTCCYEARDVSIFAFEDRLSIGTPLGMYMFGYALVNSPTQWTLKVSASFDMLKSSIADHATDSGILGSIVKLGASSENVAELGSLPNSLLHSITDLFLNEATAHALALLPNVQKVSLHHLQLISSGVIKDIADIADSIAKIQANCSFKRAHYCSYRRDFVGTSKSWNRVLWNSSAIEVVSSDDDPLPLATLIPCKSNTILCKRRFLDFSVARIIDNLFINAILSGPLSIVGLYCYPQLPPPETFVALLRDNEPHNMLHVLRLNFPPSHINCLSRALRKRPEVTRLYLNRSRSVNDLSTVGLNGGAEETKTGASNRRHSCPDLMEIQSLHSMHSELYKATIAEPVLGQTLRYCSLFKK